MTYVSVAQLSFRYASGGPPVIDGLSFTMERGEVVGVVGASGCGKSTLLRLLAGLEEPAGGRIAIDGRLVADDGFSMPAEKRGVGMVFQDYALFPHLTIAGNIAFGLHKLRRSRRGERVREMLELVRLAGFAKRYPHELSGGQQQRVALARSLAPEPSILLMDEPFSNLDAGLKASIREELRHILREAKMTCLIVSHDRDDIDAICDRALAIGS